MKKIICIGILLSVLCCGLAEAQTDGQTRIAKEERTRYVEDSLLAARLGISIERLRDSVRLMATRTYVVENYVTNTDSRLSDSRTPMGAAGGDLTGTYPNPSVKSSVNLTGSPTATTPVVTNNSNRIATTAYVKNNLANYITTSDNRLTDSRTPMGAAGGDLTGTYPNPSVKSSVNLTGNPTVAGTLTVNGTGESLIKGNLRLKGAGAYGNKLNLGDGDYVYLYEETDDNLTIKAKNISLSPTASVTAPTPATSTNNTQIATTAYVKSNLASIAQKRSFNVSNNYVISPGETIWIDAHISPDILIACPSESELNHNSVARIICSDGDVFHFRPQKAFMELNYWANPSSCQDAFILYEIFWGDPDHVLIKQQCTSNINVIYY